MAGDDSGKAPERLGRALTRQRARHRSVDVTVAGYCRFKRTESDVSAVHIAYQAFFSLFPLLFAMVGILGLILRGNESLRAKLLESVTKNVPAGALQDLVTNSVQAAQHSAGTALGVGLVLLLYSGTGVVAAVERGLDRAFGVSRPAKLLMTRLRALGYLVSVGLLLAVSVVAGSLIGGAAGSILSAIGISGAPARLAASAAAVAVVLLFDVGLFLLTFKLLPNRKVKARKVLPAAIISAVWWGLAKTLGALYIAHSVKSAGQVFGQFAVILGLLVFANLAAQLLLFTACAQAEMLGDPELVQVIAKDAHTAELIKDQPAEVTAGAVRAGGQDPA